MTAARHDPKPEKRYRATKQEWESIREAFSEDCCWVCGGEWTELHHILNRSHSGDDVVVNLAPVCQECHRRIEARDPQARSLIRQALMPSNLAYLRYKLGENTEGWLERHYPLGNFSRARLGLDLGLDLEVDLGSFTKSQQQTLVSGKRTNAGGRA